MDVIHKMLDLYPDVFELATTAEGVRNAFAKGKVASLIGVEGAHSIDSSLAVLRMLFDLGARYLTLTHNSHDTLVDSQANACLDNVDCKMGDGDVCVDGSCTKDQLLGLTDFGKEVRFEMNRLGMLVDLSHVSVGTMHAALNLSVSPLVFTHFVSVVRPSQLHDREESASCTVLSITYIYLKFVIYNK